MSRWHDPSHRFLVIWGLWERLQKGILHERPSREYRFYSMISKNSLRVRI
jgi:hypothetical protein